MPAVSVHAMDGEKALANFTKKFNQEISKEYGFFLFGSGVSFPVKIEDIILSYNANCCENLDGARELAVKLARKMIDRMNEDKNLLKYLSNNPASVKHVDLRINFKDPLNGRTPGSIASVSVIGLRNTVFFSTYNESGNLITLHKEKFEEAEKIVRQNSSITFE